MTSDRTNKIKQQLISNLQPTILEVVDEGHLHIGHEGAKTGRGHFAVTISSPLFHNKNKVKCHQMVYQALGNLMNTDIHALRITIK